MNLVEPVQRCLHLFLGLCWRWLRRLPIVALSGLLGGGFAEELELSLLEIMTHCLVVVAAAITSRHRRGRDAIL